MRLLIISDTHVVDGPGRSGPRRVTGLPGQVWAEVDSADVVVHAGDWVAAGLVDELAARASRLVAVHGNNDGAQVRARLPAVARADLAGVRLAVVHETGAAAGRQARCTARFPDADVVVFGHSHLPWDTVAATTGQRLLNPGSPTDPRRQPRPTYLTGVVERGRLRDVRLVPVEAGWQPG